MKRFLLAVISIGIIFGVTYKADAISNYIVGFITDNHKLEIAEPNEYKKEDKFLYVSNEIAVF